MKTTFVAVSAMLLAGHPALAGSTDSLPLGTLLDTTTNSAGQQITVPVHPSLHVATFEDPAGWASEWHRHVYPRYLYVLSGQLTVEDQDSHQRHSVQAGQAYVEVIGAWHRGMNLGPDKVRFVVIDQVEPGYGPNMIMQKQGATEPAK